MIKFKFYTIYLKYPLESYHIIYSEMVEHISPYTNTNTIKIPNNARIYNFIYKYNYNKYILINIIMWEIKDNNVLKIFLYCISYRLVSINIWSFQSISLHWMFYINFYLKILIFSIANNLSFLPFFSFSFFLFF